MKRIQILWEIGIALLTAASKGLSAGEPAIDYAQPEQLTGRVLERGSNKLLFHFKRTATRVGPTARVLREFTNPDGSLAARERVTYESGRLIAFQLDELQTGGQGTTTVAPDARHPGRKTLVFEYSAGPNSRKKTSGEALQNDTLIGDMIPYFILLHWDQLMRGDDVKFRFIAQSRLETVGFKLLKDGETTVRGAPAVRLKMQASSLLIAQIVDPLFFLVEKNGAHRVFQYDGRTTPKARQGDSWKDLDAVTVYDWK